MSIFKFGGEGQADETVLSVANSGTGGQSPLSAVSATAFVYDTATAMHGASSLRGTWVASTLKEARWDHTAAGETHVVVYIRRSGSVTTAHTVLQVRNGSAMAADLFMQSTSGGRLVVRNAASTGLYNNSAANIADVTWYRAEYRVTKGTTTSNGRIQFALYTGDGTTPLATYDSGATTNTGTTDLTNMRFGRPGSTTTDVTSEWFDSLTLYTGADVPGTMSNVWSPPTSDTYYQVRQGGVWVPKTTRPKVRVAGAWT